MNRHLRVSFGTYIAGMRTDAAGNYLQAKQRSRLFVHWLPAMVIDTVGSIRAALIREVVQSFQRL